MLHCIYVHMLLGLATIALGIAGFAPSRCDLSVLVNRRLLQFSHRLGSSAHSDSQQEQLQRAGHEPVLPCACLWTSTCLCLTALFRTALTHILRAFYSADIGIPLTQPLISALRALCLRSWPANWTVSLDLTVSCRHYNGFISSF